jgi:hypothetical protein
MSRLSRIGRTFTSCVGKSKTIDDDEQIKPKRNHDREWEDQQKLLHYDLPQVISEEFYERVRKDAVVVDFLDHIADCVTGYVSVRNDAPEKQVIARYSTNGWETYVEAAATWLGSVEAQNCDKFCFQISSLGRSYTVHLAVRYEVLDQQYWDNNNNENYTVVQEQ